MTVGKTVHSFTVRVTDWHGWWLPMDRAETYEWLRNRAEQAFPGRPQVTILDDEIPGDGTLGDVPVGDKMYNVDEARKARGYKPGAQWYFTAGGNVYGFPLELSVGQVRRMQSLHSSDIEGLLNILLGDQRHAFAEEGLTLPDIAKVLEAYLNATEGAGAGRP